MIMKYIFMSLMFMVNESRIKFGVNFREKMFIIITKFVAKQFKVKIIS